MHFLLKKSKRVVCICYLLCAFTIFSKVQAAIQISDEAISKNTQAQDLITFDTVAKGSEEIKSSTYSLLKNSPAITTTSQTKISKDTRAIDYRLQSPFAYLIATDSQNALFIRADDVAVEAPVSSIGTHEKVETKTPDYVIVRRARSFWEGAEKEYDQRNVQISGTKTFEMRRADISGDLGHFSTENYEFMPGFQLDQSLHLRIEGNITENATVNAVLDDKHDEERRFTVNIDGPVWQFVMGDFPLFIEGTEFTTDQKQVRGILARWNVRDNYQSHFLFTQSKGIARREQFRGAGQQQEFRLGGYPIVRSSERISIDGQQLTRGNDYFIDYEDGLIKFMPHILPIEVTRWIVIEYEVEDESMAFSRNLYGSRQVYEKSDDRVIGVTWLREIDSSTPRGIATSTATPMQHDIIGTDLSWQLNHNIKMNAESSISVLNPNINSNENISDREIKGNASRIGFEGKNDRAKADISYKRIDKNFKVVGREGGVTELGERGLVNDIMSGRARLSYRFSDQISTFVDSERSETNLKNEVDVPSIDFRDTNAGFVYRTSSKNRIELRKGKQTDREIALNKRSDMGRDTEKIILDRQLGDINTQTSIKRTNYKDSINIASGSEVIEKSIHAGSSNYTNFEWNLQASRITIDDETVVDDLRSETRNYSLDMSYNPSRDFDLRGIFQWRTEDDNLTGTRLENEIADAQLRYEPNRDLRTQVKYKVENTSRIIRDPDLDREDYIVPPTLPNTERDEYEILRRFENPVQQTTSNVRTDYRINRFLQAYFDWRRRDVEDQKTNMRMSINDRKTYELRYTPARRMQIIAEYEEGLSQNKDQKVEIDDWFKGLRFRHEFYEGCFLDAAVEQKNEVDRYQSENDSKTETLILGYQQIYNTWATFELELRHNQIESRNPAREWEQRLAVILTPYSRAQRYRFFINHKDISAEKSGRHIEGGLNFSQFIGTDTMIDGEIKKVSASEGLRGDGYSALVFNSQVVITF